MKIHKRLGNPLKWSDEKWKAFRDYRKNHGVWPTREVEICMGCGWEAPCKSDCPAGTFKCFAR